MNRGFELNPGMFIQPKATPTSAWTGHIPFAGWLVNALKPQVFVELGTHHGASYLAFCQAAREAGLGVRAFAVDTWQGDEHSGHYGEEVYAELHGYNQAHYGDFSTLMQTTFDDAAGYFEAGSVDLLHIDGLHTYEAVRHDFETWKSKLSSRAIVLFHDTCVRERGFGVWKFFAELKEEYPSFEFTHTHGLGLIIVGSDIPREVEALTKLGAQQRVFVQDMFARLGDAACHLAENDRLRQALAHVALAGDNGGSDQGELRELLLAKEHAIRLDMINVKETILTDARDARHEHAEGMRDVKDAIVAFANESRSKLDGAVGEINASILGVKEASCSGREEAIRELKASILAAAEASRGDREESTRELKASLLAAAEVSRSTREEALRELEKSLLAAVEALHIEGAKAMGDLKESILAESREWGNKNSGELRAIKEAMLAEVRGVQSGLDEAIRQALDAMLASATSMRKEQASSFSELSETVRDGASHQASRLQALGDTLDHVVELLGTHQTGLARLEGIVQGHVDRQESRRMGAKLRRLFGGAAPGQRQKE